MLVPHRQKGPGEKQEPDAGPAQPAQEPRDDKSAVTSSRKQGRSKRWATKTKTGCLTCRARRVKCDEAKPFCRKCTAFGRTCQGYQMSKDMTVVDITMPSDLKHESLKLADALLYFELRIQPKVIRQAKGAGTYQSTRPSVQAHMVFLPDAFIMRTINHKIVTLSQENHVLPKFGALPSITYLWSRLYEYIGSVMRELNRLIDNGDDVHMILHYILSIFAIEGTIIDSAWRLHVEGFAALVQLYGGVKTLNEVPMTSMALRHMFIYATVANTTSPTNDQITGFDMWTTEEVVMSYSHSGFSSFPCATTMFLDMMKITHLRRVCAADPNAVYGLMPEARRIYNRLQNFEPTEWKESYELPEVFPLLAETFKTSIILYAILSLPRLLSAQFTCPQEETTQSPHIYYRSHLYSLVVKGMATVERNESFTWPIAVLGVAFYDGEHTVQDSLLRYLDGIIMRPGVDCGAVSLLLRLNEFWGSGKRNWEGCFYKSTSVLA